MIIKELNKWFNTLDTDTLTYLFFSEWEEVMESCDPDVNINTFYKEVKSIWKGLPKQEKMDIYDQVQNMI